MATKIYFEDKEILPKVIHKISHLKTSQVYCAITITLMTLKLKE